MGGSPPEVRPTIEAVVFEEGGDVQGRFGPGAAAVGADDQAAARPDCALDEVGDVLVKARFGHAVSQRVGVAEASRRAPIGGLGDPAVVPEPRQPPSRRRD